MKIAFIGTHCNGKTTLVNEFLQKWPMYKKSKTTYRNLIKKDKLKNNKEGTEESQRAILNALIDEVQKAVATGDENLIFDRCVIDNIVYSLWLNEKGKIKDSFIMDSKFLALETIKLYDIIFYLPLREEIKLSPKDDRDLDPVYRKEIDNIFQAVVQTYEKNQGIFFPLRDCPAVITLDGPPDLRCDQIQLYIKNTGNPYNEEDGSLIYT
jgi:thymidylate kinase